MGRRPKIREQVPQVMRTCLRCNESFPSYSAGNRICDPCAIENASKAKRRERGGKRQAKSGIGTGDA